MCGRFTIMLDADDMREAYQLGEIPPDWRPRYNAAPTQSIGVIRESNPNRLVWMRWGLVPSWAKDLAIGSKMINARSETLLEKPSFKNAFVRRRCLIPADGFYEWLRSPNSKNPSIPYYFQLRDKKPFVFAGLWEQWRGSAGDEVNTCTIITCQANEVVGQVHPRMPVIFELPFAWKWLESIPIKDLNAMLLPFPGDQMESTRVSSLVNRPDMDDPACLLPE